MRISKKLVALCAFFVVAAVAVAGCGGSSNSVGSGSVANVAGNAISKRAWTHWMFVYAKQESQEYAEEGETEPVVVPDPPNFEKCMAELKTSASFATSTKAVLKRDCAEVFQEANAKILVFLIEGYWYQGLAHKEGITVTNAEIQKKLKAEITSHFKTKAELASYFKESGETKADLEWQLRAQLAFAKLIKHYEKPVTADEVSGYYSENPSKFTTPEERDAHVLRISSGKDAKATAQQAYQALKSGESWTAAVKKYSSGSSSSNNGGLIQNITDGSDSSLEDAAAKAVFAAKVGQVVGPVKGVYGYYVIEVTKVNPAKKTPLNTATKAEIKKTLQGDAQTKAKAKIESEAHSAFGSRTKCADGYAVEKYCANYASAKPAPLPKAPATSSSGSSSSGSSTATTGSSSGSSSSNSSSGSSSKSKKK
jgi:foldase protein PrsA